MEKNKKSAGERPGDFQILQKIIAEFLLNNNPPYAYIFLTYN